jgi:hypothetical protein
LEDSLNQETQVIEVTLPNGATVGIEASVFEPVAEAEEERRISLTDLSFSGVNKAIEGMIETLWTSLQKAAPEKATVEFGFEIAVKNGELTGIFVKGSGKTNLKVTLEWSGKHISAPTQAVQT